MEEDSKINLLVEWAIFCKLDNQKDLEFILLKGHLILESILEIVLLRNNFTDVENYSFYRKILSFELLTVEDIIRKEFIVSSLKDINKLRNKIAHEINFDINDGEFEKWSSSILNALNGKKFSKYTFRSKIVHAFSMLSMNILEIRTTNNNLK